jgi:repressor LexA
MRELTHRQAAVLEFLRERHHVDGNTPTYREIAARFGFKSPRAAMDHVSALEKKGYVRRHCRRSRGIELIFSAEDQDHGRIQVPILGQISAGCPLTETQHHQGFLVVDKALLGCSAGHRLFALRVNGDSMTGRGIHEGDWVVVDSDAPRRIGDVAVALIDGESTIKTLAMENGIYVLRAENPDYPDPIPLGEMETQGVIRIVLRRMG